jgi:hypothetical protein
LCWDRVEESWPTYSFFLNASLDAC